jgi:uncharacterized protein
MKRWGLMVLVLTSLARASSGYGQEVRVSPTNRTMAVQATASVRVDPEIAIVGFGYQNYGLTKDQAYAENKKAADKILQTLLGAGIPQDTIETDYLEVSAVQEDRDWSAEDRRTRKFEAKQSWKVRSSVPMAQKIVDWAVTAEATEVQPVQWIVADPQTVEDKAAVMALEKARALGQQMAKEMDLKLGAILSISNGAAGLTLFDKLGKASQTVTVNEEAKPSLRLFPEKIERSATVSVVFAIE